MTSPLLVYDITTSCVWCHNLLYIMSPHLEYDASALCAWCHYILWMTSQHCVYNFTTSSSCRWRHNIVCLMSSHLVNDVTTLCVWCHHILRLVEFNQNANIIFILSFCYSFIIYPVCPASLPALETHLYPVNGQGLVQATCRRGAWAVFSFFKFYRCIHDSCN